MASISISCPSCSATEGVVLHSSKTEAFSSAVNVRLIQKTSATPCFHITVALTN
ncbi:hypothetical protein FHC11_17035 [Citrobacter portucalensis]|uniref:IS1 family transposase n=1 Tax=Citrobacter portucalensis TaxID=1639133 RepID=UPI001C70AB8F|nr:hypothetical protein [Citrobacter portucalensis]